MILTRIPCLLKNRIKFIPFFAKCLSINNQDLVQDHHSSGQSVERVIWEVRLLVSWQQLAKPMEPRMAEFDYPSARLESWIFLDKLFLLSSWMELGYNSIAYQHISFQTYAASRQKFWGVAPFSGLGILPFSIGSKEMLSCLLAPVKRIIRWRHVRRHGGCALFHFFPLSVEFGPIDSWAKGASIIEPSAVC